METEVAKKLGRPLEYTKEMGDHICELVATNDCGLLRLTQLYPDLPPKQTINRWRYRVPEFRAQYAMAKMEQADLLAEQCLEIADDSSKDVCYNEGQEVVNAEVINRARLRIDTRKWLASKLIPRQYGNVIEDKSNINASIVEKLVLSTN